MKLRSPDQVDFLEEQLLRRTENVLNSGFLWLMIIKETSRQPLKTGDLRKVLAQKYFNPHRNTLYSAVLLLKTMRVIEERPDKKLQATKKGLLVLERGTQHLTRNLHALKDKT